MNEETVAIVTRKWREYFSLSYYTKEGKWPVIEETSYEQDNYLTRALKNNYPLDRAHPDYRDTYWDQVIFGKTFDVPDKFEFTEMISDKATSMNKEDLRERTGCDRSVIVSWLRPNFQNPHEFLQQLRVNGFNPDTEVAGVCPKEREMMPAPRLFGLMTSERRLYTV